MNDAGDLHDAILHLLRQLRRVDVDLGLGTAQTSALSVIVFQGPLPVGRLAEIEQVRPPTMTRTVDALERQGLVRRVAFARDRRIVEVQATRSGQTRMREGRNRRVEALARRMDGLPQPDLERLRRAIDPLKRLAETA